jgi:hypothetical protein
LNSRGPACEFVSDSGNWADAIDSTVVFYRDIVRKYENITMGISKHLTKNNFLKQYVSIHIHQRKFLQVANKSVLKQALTKLIEAGRGIHQGSNFEDAFDDEVDEDV